MRVLQFLPDPADFTNCFVKSSSLLAKSRSNAASEYLADALPEQGVDLAEQP